MSRLCTACKRAGAGCECNTEVVNTGFYDMWHMLDTFEIERTCVCERVIL